MLWIILELGYSWRIGDYHVNFQLLNIGKWQTQSVVQGDLLQLKQSIHLRTEQTYFGWYVF
jgi:hypothetical protein